MAEQLDRHTSRGVTEVVSALSGWLNEDALLDLAVRFSETYTRLARTSLDQFLITPVTALPTGAEKGKFLSIDVGGSNLRAGFVELLGDAGHVGQNGCTTPLEKIRRSCDKSWPIGDHLKMDKAEDLFQWIGDCIATVIADAMSESVGSTAGNSVFGEELLLGITFSFPMAQKRLSEATLLPMGKGFAITSNLNLGNMLLAGYARHVGQAVGSPLRGHASIGTSSSKLQTAILPRIRVAAITNDTVATFASLAYAVKAAPNSRVAMGLIVGTGTNATVPMKLDSLHPIKRDDLSNPDGVETVVVNTEWTINGTEQPLLDLNIKTPWDLRLDAESDAPGFQPFEYMTSGRYLGEIVRLAFADTTEETVVDFPPLLRIRNALPTRFLSEVVARADDATLARELNIRYASPSSDSFWSRDRIQQLKDIAYAVQQRSSALVAAASVGLLDSVHDIHLDRPEQVARNGSGRVHSKETEELVIAYAGGTISQYPQWLETCQRWVNVLVSRGSANIHKRVSLREALDGGIVGAGVLAGMTDNIA